MQNTNEQVEAVTIVGVRQKAFEDGGVKWMLRDGQDRVFQFYQTDARGRETSQYREYQRHVLGEMPYAVTLRFAEQHGVGATGEAYTLYKVLGFEG